MNAPIVAVFNAPDDIPEFDNEDQGIDYLKKIYDTLFIDLLSERIAVEEHFPQKRTWKMFREWFEIEINSEVIDWLDSPIEKEDDW